MMQVINKALSKEITEPAALIVTVSSLVSGNIHQTTAGRTSPYTYM